MWVPGRFVPLVLLLAAGGAGAQAPAAGGDADARSRHGQELMAAGRYGEAAAVFRGLLRSAPNDVALLLGLGKALHLAGKDEEAIAPLETAVRLQPDSVPANLFLGGARLQAGRAEAALAPLQKAVRLQPDNLDARSVLAQALLGLGRVTEAEPHLRRLTALAPADPAAWFNLGRAYEDLAAQSADALLDRDPESAYALALAAEARLEEGRKEAAFHLYRQAIERGPDLRGLHAAVAGIYRGAGHPDWAAAEEGQERRRPRPDCTRATPECAFGAGKYLQAVGGPAGTRTPEAAYWAARAYGELARQALARLTALPPSLHSHEWLAEIARRQRRYADAEDHWRKAIAFAPGDPRLLTELALTLRLDRDLAGAQRIVEDALRKAPEAPAPNALLGNLLVERGLPARAIPFLETAVRSAPEEPQGQGALGRAYALVGRPEDAIPHLKAGLPADADGSLRLQLARAYQAAGRTELGREAMRDYEDFKRSIEDSNPSGAAATITPPPDFR